MIFSAITPDEKGGNMTYVSTVPWKNESQHTLVMACSDPRTAVATYEFLKQHCDLSRFDPIMRAGGPATVLLSATQFFVTRMEISLLHERHEFKHIIGIAHDDCGWYKYKYPELDADKRRQKQKDDLNEFRKVILKLVPNAAVQLFFAQCSYEGFVQFLEVST